MDFRLPVLFRHNRQPRCFDATTSTDSANPLPEKLREILKSGFRWSDRELHERLCFNLQVRHAVGVEDWGEEVFELRRGVDQKSLFGSAWRHVEPESRIDTIEVSGYGLLGEAYDRPSAR